MKKKYSEMIPAEKEFIEVFQGWTIDVVGMTEEYEAKSWGVSRVEGGLTFILKKGTIKKKVILGYTELGEWIEHEEKL